MLLGTFNKKEHIPDHTFLRMEVMQKIFSDNKIIKMNINNEKLLGWARKIGSSAIKNPGCSCRKPRFSSHHPPGG